MKAILSWFVSIIYTPFFGERLTRFHQPWFVKIATGTPWFLLRLVVDPWASYGIRDIQKRDFLNLWENPQFSQHHQILVKCLAKNMQGWKKHLKAWATYIKNHLTLTVNGGLDMAASQSDLNSGRWKMDRTRLKSMFWHHRSEKGHESLHSKVKWEQIDQSTLVIQDRNTSGLGYRSCPT